MRLGRRHTAGLLVAALARPAIAQARLRVVVVGGGPGGVTAARALAGDARVAVTLVERRRTYRAPWLFNAVLGGLAQPGEYGYGALEAPGVAVRFAEASAVDVASRSLRMADGEALGWDRLVLAPGIEMKAGLPGADPAGHGWSSEAGIAPLLAGLERVPAGGTVVLVTPPLPMRCPPAPYERASMIAHRLRSTGRADARVTILDAKEGGALLGLFQAGWEENQPGQVEWLPPSIHGGVERVEGGAVVTGLDAIKADLVCAIPPHGAGRLAAPFADGTGFCPIDPATMRVRAADGVFVVGDAAVLSPIPKSAVVSAASGRVAAAAILAELDGRGVAAPTLDNMCWARLAPANAVRSADRFRVAEGALQPIESSVSGGRETAAVRAAGYAEAERWAASFGAGLFG